MDFGVRSKLLMDMHVAFAAEFKYIKERVDAISRYAL
jgi:hypothetical protein